jgi:hypothetical protein
MFSAEPSQVGAQEFQQSGPMAKGDALAALHMLDLAPPGPARRGLEAQADDE